MWNVAFRLHIRFAATHDNNRNPTGVGNMSGGMYLAAFNGRDYALLMLINTFGQFLTLVSAIVADLSYTLFDPRVRIGSGKLS